MRGGREGETQAAKWLSFGRSLRCPEIASSFSHSQGGGWARALEAATFSVMYDAGRGRKHWAAYAKFSFQLPKELR